MFVVELCHPNRLSLRLSEVLLKARYMDYGPIQEELLEYILSHIVLGVEFSLREDESPKRWYNLN